MFCEYFPPLPSLNIRRIIVGVKYCFRYNARNRAIARGEDGDPINLEPIPRSHRRRREKKLMTMDEVNERFPMTKYKTWVAARASEGLSTAGGVTAPANRPGSVTDADGVIPQSPIGTKHDRPNTAMSTRGSTDVKPSPSTVNDPDMSEKADTMTGSQHLPDLKIVTTAITVDTQKTHSEDEADEDDHIHDALPPELMAHPGDSCAICIDTLEDDDDIRGLTCGHAFHAVCLDPWLTSRRACCPLCKADYYVPKPRPEGEPAEPERPRRTGRVQTAAQPRPAWLGARVHPRMLLPVRFMSNPMYPGDRYGHAPADDRRSRRARRVVAQTRPPASTQNSAAAQDIPRTRLSSRIGAVNPFGRITIPRMPFIGRTRRTDNVAAQPTNTPTPGQLESGGAR